MFNFNPILYYFKGLNALFDIKVLKYIIFPIIVNIIALSILFIIIPISIYYFLDLNLPSEKTYNILSIIVSIAIFISFVLLFFFNAIFFMGLSTILASPFYTKLSLYVSKENLLENEDLLFVSIFKEIFITIKRELKKLSRLYIKLFFIWIISLIFAWIPVIGILLGLYLLYKTSRVAYLQFSDYFYEVTNKDLDVNIADSNINKADTISLGFIIYISNFIPLWNIINPVIAVCATTYLVKDIYLHNLDANSRKFKNHKNEIY